jgi:hypothetical protein
VDLILEVGNAAPNSGGVWEVGPSITQPVLVAGSNGWVQCAIGNRCIVQLSPDDQDAHLLTCSMRDADGRSIGGFGRKEFVAGQGMTTFTYNFYQPTALLSPGSFFVMATLDERIRRERTLVVVPH